MNHVTFEMSLHQAFTVLARIMQGETEDAILTNLGHMSPEQAFEAYAALVSIQGVLPPIAKAVNIVLHNHGYTVHKIQVADVIGPDISSINVN